MNAAVAELAEGGRDIPEPSNFAALEAEGGQVIGLPVIGSFAYGPTCQPQFPERTICSRPRGNVNGDSGLPRKRTLAEAVAERGRGSEYADRIPIYTPVTRSTGAGHG